MTTQTQIIEVEEYFAELNKKSPATVKTYKVGINMFLEYFKIESVKQIESLKRKDIVKFVDSIPGSNSTKNTRVRPVSAFINWMIESEYIERNPFSHVHSRKEESKVRLVLSEEEQEKLLNVTNNENEHLMILLMLKTGVRRGEVVKIKYNLENVTANRVEVYKKILDV